MPVHKSRLASLVVTLIVVLGAISRAQSTRPSPAELRGSVTAERAWWDLQHYDLSIEVFPDSKSLKGSNVIEFRALASGSRIQIDLQPPLRITEVHQGGRKLTFETSGNVNWIQLQEPIAAGAESQIVVDFEGQPTESRNPPWSGGLSWKKDSKGKPFIATTCQGIGASIWWPNKDHGYDEPDRGMTMKVTVPEELTAVSNGRLTGTETNTAAKTRTFHWEVTNPINNYGVNLNIGNYVSWSDVHEGEFGKLDVQYWVLEDDRAKAEKQFGEVGRVLEAFEFWFGKYPFYEDSFKLVQVPYLGMEHQSSVTYGNGFRNGYRGSDLSGTGVGMKFDFIIVHESAHEWFGNNISMKDAADMWIHESFASYAESLFVEHFFTKEEAADYVIGTRRNIRNDRPIIGEYGLNREGSGDMYYKGSNMLHTLRQIVDDDLKWRTMLKGLNATFWHQTVTSKQIEDYMAETTGLDLAAFFDQYLRTTQIPTLEYQVKGKAVRYRFKDVVKGFSIPVKVNIDGELVIIRPTTATQVIHRDQAIESFVPDRNLYLRCKSH